MTKRSITKAIICILLAALMLFGLASNFFLGGTTLLGGMTLGQTVMSTAFSTAIGGLGYRAMDNMIFNRSSSPSEAFGYVFDPGAMLNDVAYGAGFGALGYGFGQWAASKNRMGVPDAPEGTSGMAEFDGRTVIKNNNLFDLDAVDDMGRTNLQRMEQGLAPKGHDGRSVHLHHLDQTNNGPLIEISASEHQQGYALLHPNTGQSPSLIHRGEFNRMRTNYWKWRTNDFRIGRND